MLKLNAFYNDIKDKGYSYKDCEVFYLIIDKIFNLQMEDESKYSFQDLDICITNPFLDCSGRYEVNPVEEYGDKFLRSNFIALLDRIKNYLGSEPTKEQISLCISMNIENIIKYQQ